MNHGALTESARKIHAHALVYSHESFFILKQKSELIIKDSLR